MKILTPRSIFLYCFIAIAILLGTSFYLQYSEGINPCPLCILQRFCMIILGLFFFFGALLPVKKIGVCLFSIFTTIISLLGVFLAGRQVWLQHLPSSQGSDCGVSLDYMLHVLPLSEVFNKVMQGTSECSEVGWRFLHLSLAEWSLCWFIIFAIVSILQLKCCSNKKIR